jgi:hypothetical protein
MTEDQLIERGVAALGARRNMLKVFEAARNELEEKVTYLFQLTFFRKFNTNSSIYFCIIIYLQMFCILYLELKKILNRIFIFFYFILLF